MRFVCRFIDLELYAYDLTWKQKHFCILLIDKNKESEEKKQTNNRKKNWKENHRNVINLNWFHGMTSDGV